MPLVNMLKTGEINIRCLFLLAILILIGTIQAAAQMQTTGGDFGKTWLEGHGASTVSSDEKNNLLNWGSYPRGYQVINGQVKPILASTKIYYPLFMTNSTPVYINGTAAMDERNYTRQDFLSQDFLSPDFIEDPWLYAQMIEQPVIVFYPANTKGSVLH